MTNLRIAIVCLIAALAAGCAHAALPQTAAIPNMVAPDSARSGKYIKHIVVLIQENRTFDNLFSRFPGADGTKTGLTHTGAAFTLYKAPLKTPVPLSNRHSVFVTSYDGGKMDGFDLISEWGKPGTFVYQYVDPSEIKPYWSLARQYALADHMFQTQGSGSFTAHQDLIAAGTALKGWKACGSFACSVIDQPSVPPWGCGAPSGTTTPVITSQPAYLLTKGPFPCFDYPTLATLLDAKSLKWRYYAPVYGKSWEASYWTGFDAIRAIWQTPEWKANIVSPETTILNDAKNGTLPAMTWVVPDGANSDHPGIAGSTGPSWVASVVNAIGESKYWNSTAIIIVWDDWGGFYDHVPPPQLDYAGLGFRVPMIVVSPYAKKAYVSHTQYEFGSIIKFIEANWSLGSLNATDVRANTISDMFDFAQPPRKFTPIAAKYPASFFAHERPSYLPVDDE